MPKSGELYGHCECIKSSGRHARPEQYNNERPDDHNKEEYWDKDADGENLDKNKDPHDDDDDQEQQQQQQQQQNNSIMLYQTSTQAKAPSTIAGTPPHLEMLVTRSS